MLMGTYEGSGDGDADSGTGVGSGTSTPSAPGAAAGAVQGFSGSTKKLREILRRQKADSDDEETPDVDFTYDDEDSMAAELAELYSYSESGDFQLCQKALEDITNKFDLPKTWGSAEKSEKMRSILLLLDRLEIASGTDRLQAARAILYISQGCWLECQSDSECMDNIQSNVDLLYQCGVFSSFVDLLNLEIENKDAASSAQLKLAVSLADSVELRIVLNVLYTMTLALRNHPDNGVREEFIRELNTPMLEEELLAVRLLTMVTRFCSGSAPHFPMKKCLLLLWKVLLTSLGGMDKLRSMKVAYRAKAGLPNTIEDTLAVARTMRAASPPANTADILDATNNRRNRPGVERSLMAKQSSLDDVGLELLGNNEEGDDDFNESTEEEKESGFEVGSPRPDTPILQAEEEDQPRNLPWTPKVREKELDAFLEQTRMKFVGFTLKDDRTTLAGLLQPIHDSVRILNSYMYKSLAEKQIEMEEDIVRNPISRPEPPFPETPAELLYQGMFPSLPQYMIALLKILLAAAPTAKTKSDSINIMTDVLPEEMPMTVAQSVKLGLDVNRHKEIIVKSVSAILLLLLKHFKINHVYQFEFMSQHLVFANCIPLVLKFFNQNIMAHIGAKNDISLLDFPSCVIGEQPPDEVASETLASGSSPDSLSSPHAYCWRNMFSCINLLRVLNKLTKWKRSRIMMLVVFKSAPILKRTLKVKHAILQLYVLKLLKMQSRYLGRQWRKSNMKTVSAIYTKVRHRLNEDWAYGNDVESRPWDYQAEECSLRCAVDRFNSRRYERSGKAPLNPGIASNTTLVDSNQQSTIKENDLDDYEPVDNCLNSVLGQNVELTDEFKANYEKWLQREVFNTQIQWEQLLSKADREALAKETFLLGNPEEELEEFLEKPSS